MGFGIVDIVKVREEGPLTVYAFSHEDYGQAATRGEVTIDRQTGVLGEPVILSGRPNRAGYAAAAKIKQAWCEGSLPDKLQWAG